MSTVYKDICATVVGEELPCQREDGNSPPFRCSSGQRGGHCWPHFKEDTISLLSLSTQGQVDCLSNNRIWTLIWEFSAMGT